jgi:hypothetical protein
LAALTPAWSSRGRNDRQAKDAALRPYWKFRL